MGRKAPPPPSPGGFGALGDALRARGLQGTPVAEPVPEPAITAAPVVPRESPAPIKSGGGKPVVRKETKGRGGKTVTTVTRLPFRGAALEAWVSRLKGRLGTGASLDGDAVVVQGDQVDRILALLAEEAS